MIAVRDPYRGESVKAVVVPRQDHRGHFAPDELIAWARRHMAAYKVPRQVEVADELPRSASGKVLWRVLQAWQDAQDTQGARTSSTPPVSPAIVQHKETS